MNYLSISLDIVIVITLLVSAFMGMGKGFFRTVLSLCSTFVTGIVAYFTARPVATWFNSHIYNLSGAFAGGIERGLIKSYPILGNPFQSGISGEELVNTEEFKEGTKSIFSLLKNLITNLIKPLSAEKLANYDNIASILGHVIGEIASIIVVGIIIYFLLKIVILILMKFFNSITNHGTLGLLDKMLGLFLGLAEALVVIFALCGITSLLTLIPKVKDSVTPVIEQTYVTKYAYHATDNIMEKIVVQDKSIQKFIDDLWQKKSS